MHEIMIYCICASACRFSHRWRRYCFNMSCHGLLTSALADCNLHALTTSGWFIISLFPIRRRSRLCL